MRNITNITRIIVGWGIGSDLADPHLTARGWRALYQAFWSFDMHTPEAHLYAEGREHSKDTLQGSERKKTWLSCSLSINTSLGRYALVQTSHAKCRCRWHREWQPYRNLEACWLENWKTRRWPILIERSPLLLFLCFIHFIYLLLLLLSYHDAATNCLKLKNAKMALL